MSQATWKKVGFFSATAVVAGLVFAHLSDERRVQAQSRRGGEGGSFEARFWNWLKRAQYENWAPMPGQTEDFYPGQAPHGAFLKVYMNRTAAGRPKEMPHGSIIVKENYGEDKKTLMAVTVMYKTKDYNPEHNDWYWVKYNPDGSVALTPPDKASKPIAGRFASCIECHSGAAGDDLVYIND